MEADAGRDGALAQGEARPGRRRPADAPEGLPEPGPDPWTEYGPAPGLVAGDCTSSPDRCPAQVRPGGRAVVTGREIDEAALLSRRLVVGRGVVAEPAGHPLRADRAPAQGDGPSARRSAHGPGAEVS